MRGSLHGVAGGTPRLRVGPRHSAFLAGNVALSSFLCHFWGVPNHDAALSAWGSCPRLPRQAAQPKEKAICHRIVIEIDLVISVREQESGFTNRSQSWGESSSQGIGISRTHGWTVSSLSQQMGESSSNPNPDQR